MEMAMVLAMIGIVIAAALLYYNTANTSRQTQSALGQLAQIQQSVRSLYSGQPNYTGLTTASLATSNALPNSMVSGNLIKNPYNGSVTVIAANAGGGTASGFSVAFANVPEDACKKLVTKDLGRATYSMSVGSTTKTQDDGLPFNLTDANACTNGATITWVFS
jgi:type II secretory pathway pseudopilin PulG